MHRQEIQKYNCSEIVVVLEKFGAWILLHHNPNPIDRFVSPTNHSLDRHLGDRVVLVVPSLPEYNIYTETIALVALKRTSSFLK